MQEKLNQTHHNTKKLMVIIVLLAVTTLASFAATIIVIITRNDQPEVEEVTKVVYVEVTPTAKPKLLGVMLTPIPAE
jgi:flagellar basal body-associated protein FliL